MGVGDVPRQLSSVPPCFPSLFEATVVSEERPDPEIVSLEKPKVKRWKVAPSTITRCWQEVWICKFTWVEEKFDATGNLTQVLCKTSSVVSDQHKVMVSKANNLEKHEGKRTCKNDRDPFPNLKKGDTFEKHDCKHLQFTKLWAEQWLGGSIANQLMAGFDGEAYRKEVQFSILF